MSGEVQVDWLDESFSHQLVAPKRVTATVSPRWAERAYFVVSLPGGGLFNAGRQLYPHAGRRFAFAACRRNESIVAICAPAGFTPTDDPDAPAVGPLRVEVLEPMRRLRIMTTEPGPLEVDVEFEARFPPVQTDVNRIERNGELVTEYMNLFQSGNFSGWVTVDGTVVELRNRAGFRDRGWGVRAHEGSPRRGFGFTLACELPDASLYLFLYETASGRRVFTNGWLIGAGGEEDRVTDIEHDLVFAPEGITGGRCTATFRSGRSSSVEFAAHSHLYLSTVGYRREGHEGLEGTTLHDLTDPVVVAALHGQTDAAVDATVDGVQGWGFCEVGLGVHATYRPNPERL